MAAAGFTVSFSSPDLGNLVIARAAVPVGWATWNTPPAVETSTPRVLQDEPNLTCVLCTLNLSFSSAVTTFGLEMEPDPLPNPHTITATFLNGVNTVGTIPITFATGNSSARLFAASATGGDQRSTVATSRLCLVLHASAGQKDQPDHGRRHGLRYGAVPVWWPDHGRYS